MCIFLEEFEKLQTIGKIMIYSQLENEFIHQNFLIVIEKFYLSGYFLLSFFKGMFSQVDEAILMGKIKFRFYFGF